MNGAAHRGGSSGSAAAASSMAQPSRGARRAGMALVGCAMLAVIATVAVFARFSPQDAPLIFAQRQLVLDATSMLFLLVINSVFLGIAVYMASRVHTSPILPRDMLPRSALTVVFMGAMNLGVMANHLVLLWAFIELTAVCATPLVARGSGASPRRIAWTYLLNSGLSMAITLLGILCLVRSAQLQGGSIDFALDAMAASLPALDDTWTKLGLALVVFGLGSKLGLAPLYTWLPATYEAAPASTSALLAAVQFNLAIVMLLRVLQVFQGHETGLFAPVLLVMGCLSLMVAAVQVMAARNYRRLIAYACVSSSGVIAIGLSVGGAAAYGVLLYLVSAAYVKALLFLTAGRLRAVYGTNETVALAGVIRVLPFSGALFTVGIFALLGFPPFGSFMAEMLVLSGIVRAGHMVAFALMCAMLTVIFVATGRTIFPMVWSMPAVRRAPVGESRLTALPKIGFVLALVGLGIYPPAPVNRLLMQVAQSIGGS